MAAFLAVVLLIVFAWGFLNPFGGLVGLLAINEIRPGELYPVFNAFHVERLAAIFVLMSLLFHQRSINLKSPMSRQVLFFWLALFASVPLAFWRTNSLLGAIGFLKTVVYFFLITNLVNTISRLKLVIVVFIALNAWLAISSYWAYAHGSYYVSSTFGRAEGLTSAGGDPNSLGISLVCGLPFAAMLLFYGNLRLRLLAIVTIAASLFTMVLTGSRTSFFGFVAMMVMFAITRRNKLFVLPIAVLVVLAIFVVAPSKYQKRYMSVEQRDQDLSYVNRVNAWKAGLAMMIHNPLTGVGMYNFPEANGMKYWPGSGRKVWLQPHSLYIQTGAELGIVGVAAFSWFLWSLYGLNRAIRRSTEDRKYPKWLHYYPTACNFSLFVLLFTGYAAHSLYRSTWYLLAAITSCAYSLTARDTTEKSRAKTNRLTLKTDGWSAVRAGASS
jgi:O-antigen ligase